MDTLTLYRSIMRARTGAPALVHCMHVYMRQTQAHMHVHFAVIIFPSGAQVYSNHCIGLPARKKHAKRTANAHERIQTT